MEVPVTTMLSANDLCSSFTSLIATGEAMDQNIAWVQATPILDAMSTP